MGFILLTKFCSVYYIHDIKKNYTYNYFLKTNLNCLRYIKLMQSFEVIVCAYLATDYFLLFFSVDTTFNFGLKF